MKQHNEQFFQDLAQAYVEHDGKVLQEINLQRVDLPVENLNKKVFFSLQQLKQKRRIRRLTYGLMPVAAVLLMMIIYTAVFPIFRQYETLSDESLNLRFATERAAPESEMAAMDEAEWDADDTDDIWADEVAEIADEPADTLPMDSDDNADAAPPPEEVETEADDGDAGFMFSSTIEVIILPNEFQIVEKTILSETEVSYTIINDTGHFIYLTETLITESWEWEHDGTQPLEDWEHDIAYFITIGDRHILGFHLEDVFFTLATYDDYSALFLLGEAIVAQTSLP